MKRDGEKSSMVEQCTGFWYRLAASVDAQIRAAKVGRAAWTHGDRIAVLTEEQEEERRQIQARFIECKRKGDEVGAEQAKQDLLALRDRVFGEE